MPIPQLPVFKRLKDKKRERDELRRRLEENEYRSRGSLERRINKLNGQIERLESKVDRIRNR